MKLFTANDKNGLLNASKQIMAGNVWHMELLAADWPRTHELDALLRGKPLAEAEQKLRDPRSSVSPGIQLFISESVSRRKAEEQGEQARLQVEEKRRLAEQALAAEGAE